MKRGTSALRQPKETSMSRRITERQRMKRTGSLSPRAEHIIKVLRRDLRCTRAYVMEDAFAAYDAALKEIGWEILDREPILICHNDPHLSSRRANRTDDPMPPVPSCR